MKAQAGSVLFPGAGHSGFCSEGGLTCHLFWVPHPLQVLQVSVLPAAEASASGSCLPSLSVSRLCRGLPPILGPYLPLSSSLFRAFFSPAIQFLFLNQLFCFEKHRKVVLPVFKSLSHLLFLSLSAYALFWPIYTSS